MPRSVREVMTKNPVTLPPSATVTDAARRMRDEDVGDVLVAEGDQLRGIVTDRDITIRAVAEGERDPRDLPLEEIVSSDLVTLSPDDDVQHAVELMRQRNVRRLPVVENNQPIGVVSLGDLAVDRDPDSALADISAADPNK